MPLQKKKLKLSIGTKLTAVCFLFMLFPALLLFIGLLNNWQKSAIEERSSKMERSLYTVESSVEQASDLCNLSTQVFLNTRSLSDYLQKLSDKEEISSEETLRFYREDILSLEKILVGNPYLYTIRVYSSESGITEMIPILFSVDRLTNIPFDIKDLDEKSWCIDYPEKIFVNSSAEHIMSLITAIKGKDGEIIGILEVGVEMDKIMTDLFVSDTYYGTDSETAFLILDDGSRYGSFNSYEVNSEYIIENTNSKDPTIQVVDSTQGEYLVGCVHLDKLGGTYYMMGSLADINQAIFTRQILLVLILGIISLFGVYVINRVIKNILKQLYLIHDGVRSFSEGNFDAAISVCADDEIGVFASQVNDLLENIRVLVKSNMERELLVKNTEIKALQNQINAHFIYNVLETIKMMAEIDERYEIADAVTSLAKLLRYSMKWNRRTVALFEEIEYINNYIALMSLRYDHQIILSLDIPDELMSIEIPKISLQPVIENSVVHGHYYEEKDCLINLKVTQKGEDCYIEITDNGSGLNNEQILRLRRQISGCEETRSSSGNGIGLHNVQDRLHMMFGENYGISVSSKLGEGTTICIKVPRKYKGDEVS